MKQQPTSGGVACSKQWNSKQQTANQQQMTNDEAIS
jgi:hypothetical protein